IECGTSTLIQGAAGTGKSTIAGMIADQVAKAGGHSALFLFDESVSTMYRRMEGLGVDLRPHVAAGLISVTQVDPAEMSPGELAHALRDAVERRNARFVLIDSL